MKNSEPINRATYIPIEADLIRALTPREAGVDFEESTRLSPLLDTELHVYENCDDTGTDFYVSLGDVALNGSQLYDFLCATAPYTRKPGVSDVLLDWQYVARPARGDAMRRRPGYRLAAKQQRAGGQIPGQGRR